MDHEQTIPDPRLMGLGKNLSSFNEKNSSAREAMFSTHAGQALVIAGSTPRKIQTGAEREVGKYTFQVKMPVTGSIIKIIPRFGQTVGADAVKENPTIAIVYEDLETKQVGLLMVESYHFMHTTFGFKLQHTQALMNLAPGQIVPEGTVFAHSSSVKPSNDYAYGTEVNVAYMTIPQVIEDGFVISESLAKRLETTMIEERVVSWGHEYYPLNLYGDENNYKPFPDVGDTVRQDGLVFGLRRYDPSFGVVEMTPKALMRPDYTYDKLTYAQPSAKVFDIDVVNDITPMPSPTPEGMNKQPDKYLNLHRRYYEAIRKEYYRLKKERGEGLTLTPKFQQEITTALNWDPKESEKRIKRTYRRTKVDDRRVTLRLVKQIMPNDGYKLTDTHGSKGVIVAIWPDENMPVDKHGTRAHMIMDPISVVKRINVGQLYEQYVNATSDMVQRNVAGMVKEGQIKPTWDYLTHYYNTVSPKMYEVVTKLMVTSERQKIHLDTVIKNGIYLYMPLDNPKKGIDLLINAKGGLVKDFPLDYGPVTYTGPSGVRCTTKDPVIIGSKYMMLLEAIPDNWSSVSTAKLQPHGIPAKLGPADRHAAPTREMPIRIAGESEIRLLIATIGPEATAELLDGSNSPAPHKAIVREILTAKEPTNIAKLIDRKQHPRGNSRSVSYVNHLLACAGIRFEQSEYGHNENR